MTFIYILWSFVTLTFTPVTDAGIALSAQEIIDKCIEAHGGKKVANGKFEYDFRKYHLTYERHDGAFTYTRTHSETGAQDILTNDDFKRIRDGEEMTLSEKKKKSYSDGLNSIHYFAFLPYFLNDEAVNKSTEGEVTIKGKEYYKIRVSFDQNGGGTDYDDQYMYWIDKSDFSMDYFAYSYHVNGGGVRFREAYNVRTVGGVTFQDYVNYKHDKTTPVELLDTIFEKGGLKELSRIELKNIVELK